MPFSFIFLAFCCTFWRASHGFSFVGAHFLCSNIRIFILAHILFARTYCWWMFPLNGFNNLVSVPFSLESSLSIFSFEISVPGIFFGTFIFFWISFFWQLLPASFFGYSARFVNNSCLLSVTCKFIVGNALDYLYYQYWYLQFMGW